jgi:hypothetical protein
MSSPSGLFRPQCNLYEVYQYLLLLNGGNGYHWFRHRPNHSLLTIENESYFLEGRNLVIKINLETKLVVK